MTIQGEEAVNTLAYSRDGKRLARGEGNNVVVCCAESGLEQCQLNVDSSVYSVAFSPDGTTVAAGCYKKIYFLDPTAGEIKSSLRGHRCAPSLSKECFLSLGQY